MLPAGNMVQLAGVSVSYVINEYETVLDVQAPEDLFEIRLAKLYENGKISEEELSDRFYDYAYANTVCASLSTISADGSYSFLYRSKNIRYDSPFLTDGTFKAAYDGNDYLEAARVALDYMKDNGAITNAEYDAELDWLSQVPSITAGDTATGQALRKYSPAISDLVSKNRLTH